MGSPEQDQAPDQSERADEHAVLRTILKGTASETGHAFFRALVETLSRALATHGAWVTEYLPDVERLRALAFRLGDRWIEDFEFVVPGTPCQVALKERRLVHYPDRIVELFPEERAMRDAGAVSYMGIPLLDLDGTVLGHLAVMDRRPMPALPENVMLFEIFAGRAAAELRRLRAERQTLEAERRIRSLTDETEYLRVELRELGRAGEIAGRSESLVQVLHDLRQVAPTDTTVLILGETGTGKELFARAIHAASGRRDKPLVKVNCAAIPAALIESEFFGHERGAFTGATSKREGRFTLADGGTLFLDEIGELPLELQGKLLRVLQEGEFEPVGSSRTRKVDVRIVAATNRDLARSISEGKFREDLYYRLSVFPITLPPLRERGDDIVLLAEEFARQFATRMGRRIEPTSATLAARLKAYSWPGNVRELQNVIERAVITAKDGQLNLDRALPATLGAPVETATAASAAASKDDGGILTVDDLARLERENIIRALERADWQVSGDSGAARLVGMAPSTLASRMKALGIHRQG
jgi:transcriptional regulator with GAF, ATPase, and Fis domain